MSQIESNALLFKKRRFQSDKSDLKLSGTVWLKMKNYLFYYESSHLTEWLAADFSWNLSESMQACHVYLLPTSTPKRF